METKMQAVQTIERVSSNVTQVSGWGSVVSAFFNEWAAAIGASVALISFMVNLWYKHKHFQLAKLRVEIEKGELIDE